MIEHQVVKYIASAIVGTMATWFVIFMIGMIFVPDFHVIAMVILLFALPTAVGVCLIGFPIFKVSTKFFSHLNHYLNVLISGLLSSILPMVVTAFFVCYLLQGGVNLPQYFASVLSVLLVGIPFLVASSLIYARWSKNA
ncbi:hypothetical protein [Microbulbifer sp. HZ11]|uniref:hypothetical protein n=1 Tax=Microbulbifer sp. HZ11 TaxID=1453501 RepID=UPI0005BABFA1|nr:hypothetical protein [Microbulbifer sp. HZ11]